MSDEIRCWCGVEGTYEELFDDACLDRSCGGTGELSCECGGDQCVCHHHGATECPGCEDCLDEEEFAFGMEDALDDDEHLASEAEG
jgi:hypothetical protein